MSDRISPMELTEEDPLDVFVHKGPDGKIGLYSRQNRRLTALLLFQACRRDETHRARCIVRSSTDAYWSGQWRNGYDHGTGLSIRPRQARAARAHHRGTLLFGDGARSIAALRRASGRRHPRCRGDDVHAALGMLLERAHVRPSEAAGDEDTLTFASGGAAPPAAEWRSSADRSSRGKGKGKGSSKGARGGRRPEECAQ
ncbi:unnamed protein product [Prorocentrum cordatum]|uniref:Uncharacterized protein n=1 Tax=Prorocentrum cordatum TaxID=2364126 RepID=A0ABN9SR70_9DINO|nr:unnamed protein product [Polarella glacialis]